MVLFAGASRTVGLAGQRGRAVLLATFWLGQPERDHATDVFAGHALFNQRVNDFIQIGVDGAAGSGGDSTAIFDDSGLGTSATSTQDGKVLDENNQPVSEATANMTWTNMSFPSGSSERTTQSDAQGLFSLTKQCGKVLEIRVEKAGYYTVDGGNGPLAFEFANPSSPEWYESDSNSPVIFHLRKKGTGTALIDKTIQILSHRNRLQAQINLITGLVKPGGTFTVTSDTSEFLPGAQAFPWTVTFKMAEGGLIETDNQFSFQAPTTGYASTATIDMTNLDRSVWCGDVTKTYYFYLPSTNTYGRLTATVSSSLPIELNYSYNPTPGARYLEPASK